MRCVPSEAMSTGSLGARNPFGSHAATGAEAVTSAGARPSPPSRIVIVDHIMSEGSDISSVTMHTVEHVIERVVAEFQEMPGMRLTVEQVGRLFGIERAMCQRVLDALIGAT